MTRATRAAAWTVVPAIGVSLLLAGTWLADAASPKAQWTGVGTGYRLASFSAVDRQGKRHELSDYANQVLVLHFWASWCPYCRKEIPKLTELATKYSDQGVRVLSISSDEDAGALTAFLKQHPLPYPVVEDANAEHSLYEQYGIFGIPVTFVIARDGSIAKRMDGSADIVGAVKRALQ